MASDCQAYALLHETLSIKLESALVLLSCTHKYSEDTCNFPSPPNPTYLRKSVECVVGDTLSMPTTSPNQIDFMADFEMMLDLVLHRDGAMLATAETSALT